MRRTLMATAAALALAVTGPAWAQDTEPTPGTAPGSTADATAQPAATTPEATTTSELPATASPIAMLAAGGALSLIAGALLIRRRY